MRYFQQFSTLNVSGSSGFPDMGAFRVKTSQVCIAYI